MFLEVYGDGLMQGDDPVSILIEERDEGMVVIVTDYSEYGTHALELLHRAGKAEPVMGRFTFAEALRVTLELLGGDGQDSFNPSVGILLGQTETGDRVK